MMRANGHEASDKQLIHPKILMLEMGKTYILSANVREILPVLPAHQDYTSILRFRIFNPDTNGIYWENGIFLDSPEKWAMYDAVYSKPDFDDCAENEITFYAGEFEEWKNIKMKFTVPGPGFVIWGWNWNVGWKIQDDWTMKGYFKNQQSGEYEEGSLITNNNGRADEFIQNWQLAFQIQSRGKNYLIDDMRFFPEDNPSVNLNSDFTDWSLTEYHPSIRDNAKWILLPVINED